jgi:hypothetical protein
MNGFSFAIILCCFGFAFWISILLFAFADSISERFFVTKPDNTTIRISTEVYEKLRALKLGRKKITFNRALEELLAASQRIESGEVRYVVGDQLFRDVAEARGQAIVDSVTAQKPAVWPDVYVSIGKADPSE